jgi:hypothetical protein
MVVLLLNVFLTDKGCTKKREYRRKRLYHLEYYLYKLLFCKNWE